MKDKRKTSVSNAAKFCDRWKGMKHYTMVEKSCEAVGEINEHVPHRYLHMTMRCTQRGFNVTACLTCQRDPARQHTAVLSGSRVA